MKGWSAGVLKKYLFLNITPSLQYSNNE